MLALISVDKPRRRLAQVLIGAWAIATSGMAPAEIYQWTDEDGQTVFSESPPRDAVHTVIKPKFDKKSPAASKSVKDQTAPLKNAQASADSSANKTAEPTAAEKKANCAKARDVLTQLQTSNRLRAKNEKGEIVYLPEEDRPQRIVDAEKSIKSWCS